MAKTTTATLPQPIATYYDQLFLMRSEENFVYKPLGRKGRIPKHEGKTVVWTRFTNPTAKTTALTEGTDPTPTGLSATTVSATVTQYGNYEQVTDLLELTAIDGTIEEIMEVLAYEAAKTIDTVVRNVVNAGGLVQYASGVASQNSLVSTNVVQVADIRKAVRKLSTMGAKPHSGGDYVAIAHPDVIYDLQGDTNWVNAHTYTEKGISGIFSGETGRMYRTRWIETANQSILTNSGSAGTEVYQTMIIGKDFFGVSDLQDLKTYVHSPSLLSPLELYSDIGWKASFATAVLNDSFAIRLESGASQ